MGRTMEVIREGTYPYKVTLIVEECPVCGVVYGLPKYLNDACYKSGQRIYCPNGHSLGWNETEEDRQRQRADAAERRAASAEAAARATREQRDQARRSVSAYRGHLTRMRNRIANGVCPVQGCKRSGFTNVLRHIAAKHPQWHAEHIHDGEVV